MMKKATMLVAVFALGFMAVAVQAEDKFDAKCPVSGKAAKKDMVVSRNGGDVYFCCGNCIKAFKKDATKYAAKANLQLVSTGQAKEKKCPFSGEKLNPATAIKINGVAVCFCCEKCQAKAEKAKDKVNLVFNDKAFKKGFRIAKKTEK